MRRQPNPKSPRRSRSRHRTRPLRSALVALAQTTELPLIAALDTQSQDLQLQVIAVLGRMQSKRAAVSLIPLSLTPIRPRKSVNSPPPPCKKSSVLPPIATKPPNTCSNKSSAISSGDLDQDRNIDDR